MSNFAEVFARETARLGATDYGRELVKAGFAYQHTGGGCTAWIREIAPDVQILITAGPDGFTAEFEPGDIWEIGLHDYRETDALPESDWPFQECATVADAIAYAGELATQYGNPTFTTKESDQ